MMARSFWVVMQKRDDGKVYADLHKTDERIYQTLEEAEEALANKPLASWFQVVEMVAEMTGMKNSRMTITRHFRQGMRDQQ